MTNMNNKFLTQVYGPFFEDNASFRAKFPTFEDFKKAMKDDDGTLAKGVYEPFFADNESFRKAYPTMDAFNGNLYTKYSDSQIEGVKDTAKETLAALYSGGFETLLKNSDKLEGMIEQAKQELAMGGNVSTTRAQEIEKRLTNLQKGLGLVEAYRNINKAETSADIDQLISGQLLDNLTPEEKRATLSEEDAVLFDTLSPTEQDMFSVDGGKENKFLKQVMGTAAYKGIELEGKTPSALEGFFPEATRRSDAGQGAVASGIGALKDVFRLPGRAIRPLGEDAIGRAAPGLSYWEEFARPDKYKTSGQEIFDEISGMQGLGIVPARMAGMKALETAAKIPGFGQKIARGASKLSGLADPARVVLNKLGQGNYAQAAGRNVLAELPNIGLDVAYEATRGDDEEGSPWASAIGGVGGSILGGTLGKAMKDKNAFLREIDQGSPEYLARELRLAKQLREAEDLTSEGGLRQLSQLDEGLESAKSRLGGERAQSATALNEDILRQKEDWLLAREMADEPTNVMPNELVAATLDIPSAYRRGIGKEALAEQLDFLRQIKETTGLDIDDAKRTIPMGGNQASRMSPLEMQAGEIDAYKGLDIGTTANKLEGLNPIERQKVIDNELLEMGVTPEQLSRSTQGELPTDVRFAATKSMSEDPESLTKMIEDQTSTRRLAKKQERRTKGAPSTGIFGDIEDMQRGVLQGILKKGGPEGEKLMKNYEDFAKVYEAQGKLPDFEAGKSVDAFLDQIATARLHPSVKANAFNDAVKLQDELNELAGRTAKGKGDKKSVDYITDAVLRRVDDKGFMAKITGLNQAQLAGGALKQLSKVPKAVIRGWISMGTLGMNLAQLAEDEKAGRKFREPVQSEPDRTKEFGEIMDAFNKKTGRSPLAGNK